MLHTATGFDSVVLGGALEERGMISFADTIDAEDTAAIRAYIISRATIAMNAPPANTGFGAPPAPEEVNTHSNE